MDNVPNGIENKPKQLHAQINQYLHVYNKHDNKHANLRQLPLHRVTLQLNNTTQRNNNNGLVQHNGHHIIPVHIMHNLQVIILSWYTVQTNTVYNLPFGDFVLS